MKRCYFFIAYLAFSLALRAQEVYVPGKLAAMEIPFSSTSTERNEATVSPIVRDLLRPEYCYVKRVSLVRKAGADFILVEFLPWLEGENTIAPFSVNGKKLGEITIRAELDPVNLYVPHAMPMLEHAGLNFRLLLYFIACLCVCAAGMEALRSRKRWLAFFRLRYRLLIAADKLRKNLRLALHTKSWLAMDKAVRAYIETVSKLFSSYPAYSTDIEPLYARSLTAQEIDHLACGPECLKAGIIDLLATIEQKRWGGGGAEFLQCLDSALRLPSLFKDTIMLRKSEDEVATC